MGISRKVVKELRAVLNRAKKNGSVAEFSDDLIQPGTGDIRKEIAQHNETLLGDDYRKSFVYDLDTLMDGADHGRERVLRGAGDSGNTRGLQRSVEASSGPQTFYHGTSDDIGGFDLSHRNRKDKGWLGEGSYLSDRPEMANTYANIKAGDADPNVLPLNIRMKKPYVASLEDKGFLQNARPEASKAFTDRLTSQGYDGAILPFSDVNEINVFDPSNIRSKFAAFDPAKKDSSNLLASLAGAGLLGGSALLPENAQASEGFKAAVDEREKDPYPWMVKAGEFLDKHDDPVQSLLGTNNNVTQGASWLLDDYTAGLSGYLKQTGKGEKKTMMDRLLFSNPALIGF